ncbi:MAG: HlyC/CorC family transporter [Lachnospiraceae bacterium]|nr:HlyC/CorC family transporter [Lachnospiraceae bacterium]
MDSSDTTRLIVLFVLLFLSAFFSSAETAFTSLNKMRIKSFADEGSKRAKLVLSLLDKNTKFLSTILIGNNIVNIAASALTTILAQKLFGNSYIGLATGILTLLVLIFGEITPKTMASIHAEKMAFIYAPIINLLMILFTPLTFLVSGLAKAVMFILRIDPEKSGAHMTENELLTIVEASAQEGVIEHEEHEMINNVVDFGDTVARDVMVPAINMTCVEDTVTYDELISIFRKDQYSRMPVYHESHDNIIGIIWAKDLLVKYNPKRPFKVTEYMREPFFTFETKKTSELMSELKDKYKSMAIVLDEYGITAGLLTIEDLIEEIVGEIRDETDTDEVDSVRRINETTFEAQGAASLDDVNKACGLELASDDYDSIAGHVINLLNHLPARGESIEWDNVKYTVAATAKNRVTKVKIELLPVNKENEE